MAGALEAWLPADPEGVDVVRVAVARRLARQLDDPATAAYVIPRVAGVLVEVVEAIAGVSTPPDGVDAGSRSELRELLKGVLG